MRRSSSLQFQRPTFILSPAMSEIIFEVREDEVGADSPPRHWIGNPQRGETWKSCALMCEKRWTATLTKRWRRRASSGCTLSATTVLAR